MLRETPPIQFKRLVLVTLRIYTSQEIEFVPIKYQSRTALSFPEVVRHQSFFMNVMNFTKIDSDLYSDHYRNQ